jgi:hypothetical protein
VTDETSTTSFLDNAKQIALSRRRFLGASAGLVAAAGILAACGDDDDDASTSTGSSDDSTTSTSGGDPSGDLAIATVAAGLEVLAVGTYKAALDAAGSGALGEVPPAVGEFVTTAMGNHQAHLDAWNKVLSDAGEAEVTEPNADLKPVVDGEFAKVKDVAGAAMLALMLEEIAAQTYLKVLPTLTSPEAIQLAGSIQVVDQQHQSVLLFALGQYPVPEVFQKTDKAAA